jgi:hypothetical protein
VEIHLPTGILCTGRNFSLLYDEKLNYKGLKTKVIKKNLNPTWNETFKISVCSLQDEIQFHVKDWNLLMKDQNISWLKFTVGSFDLQADKEVTKWLTLGGDAGEIEVGLTAEGWDNYLDGFRSLKPDDKDSYLESMETGRQQADSSDEESECAPSSTPSGPKVWTPSSGDKYGITAQNKNYTEISPEIGKVEVQYGVNFEHNLLKSIPVELTLLNCNALFLGFNQLETLPKEIGNMIKLENLMLFNNKLKSLPEEIGRLINLKCLRVDNNELETLPSSIGNLSQLESLHAENNKISKIPDEVGNLKKLEWLSLGRNPIKRLCKGLANTRPLKYFYIDDAKLEWPPKGVLGTAKENGRLECYKHSDLQVWISEHQNEA